MLRFIFTWSLAVFCLTKICAQKTATTTDILTAKEVTELFSNTTLATLKINFPLFRVYRYGDKTGQYYCILTESRDEITSTKDTFNHKIKAINVKASNGSFTKLWEINDNIIKNDHGETSISFSTKYIDFKDDDGDGQADPIIIYSTWGTSGLDDGRLKIILYYKGQKISIRHQNAILDFERETQVDKLFYDLPQSIQLYVKQKMALMVKNNHALFPAGWQTAMNAKKTSFNERKR